MAKKKSEQAAKKKPGPFESAFTGLAGEIQSGLDKAFANYLKAVKAAWADADPGALDVHAVAAMAAQLLSVCAWRNGQAAGAAYPWSGAPSSPFMAAPSSPFMAAPSSPFMAAPSSPFMAAPSSPFMAAPSSPFMAAPSSPFMAAPSSPFMAAP